VVNNQLIYRLVFLVGSFLGGSAWIPAYLAHPLEGYRRLTFMKLDRDVVAVSPSSVYRVLSAADLLRRWNGKASRKGTGFVQPLKPHEHWHIDVSYVNLCGTFYYLCSILDGCSRFIVHWEPRQAMTEKDVATLHFRLRQNKPDLFSPCKESLSTSLISPPIPENPAQIARLRNQLQPKRNPKKKRP
jgi:transposase InsO family protein